MRVGGNGMVIVGGGIVESVFSYSNPTLTVGTASYPVTRMVFLSAVATIGMGAAPGAVSAVNIDGASYANNIFRAVNVTRSLDITLTSAGIATFTATSSLWNFQTTGSGNHVRFSPNSVISVQFNGVAAGTAELKFMQSTSRVIPGSATFALRNNANSADEWLWTAGGTILALTQATENQSVLTSTGYSLTGASSGGMVSLAGTWNTSGTPTALSLSITNTASNAASLLINLLAGAGGVTSMFSVRVDGRVNAVAYAVGGAAGASFGPGLPTSLTIVNGLVTAAT